MGIHNLNAFKNGTHQIINNTLPYDFKVLSTSMAFLDSLPEEYSGLDANVIAKKLWARRSPHAGPGDEGDGVRVGSNFLVMDCLVERWS